MYAFFALARAGHYQRSDTGEQNDAVQRKGPEQSERRSVHTYELLYEENADYHVNRHCDFSAFDLFPIQKDEADGGKGKL